MLKWKQGKHVGSSTVIDKFKAFLIVDKWGVFVSPTMTEPMKSSTVYWECGRQAISSKTTVAGSKIKAGRDSVPEWRTAQADNLMSSRRQEISPETGKQEPGEQRQKSWSGTEGWDVLPGGRQSRGARDRQGHYQEVRQKNTGKFCMAKKWVWSLWVYAGLIACDEEKPCAQVSWGGWQAEWGRGRVNGKILRTGRLVCDKLRQ